MAKNKDQFDGGLFNVQRPTSNFQRPKEHAAPEAGAPATIHNELVEYTPLGTAELWRVEKYFLLSAEFDLSAVDLPQFHDVASTTGKAWVVCQRLYGMKPVLLPRAADPEQYRALGASEIADLLGIQVREVSQELDVIRGRWRVRKQGIARESETLLPQISNLKFQISNPEGELVFQDEETLKKYQFPLTIFHWAGRQMDEARIEMGWFVERVMDFAKMLDDKVAGALARQALLGELNMRRLEMASFQHAPGSKDWQTSQRNYEAASDRYRNLIKELNAFFPLAAAIAYKNVFKGQLSDLICGYQEYYANGDNRLFDGMFTALEIQVECRRSVQATEPQYRASLPVMVNAAKAGLFDPKWKLQFSPRQLARLDAAWKKAFVEGEESDGVMPVDLMKEDGEFPPLYQTGK
jgi:hypothetical protein